MKCVERDKLLDFIKQYADKAPVGKEARLAINAMGIIICGWPVVDAEPVVRCNGCKYWEDSEDGRYYGGWCFCDRLQMSTSPDYYCADGEKADICE